ncbi:MAG TPA: S-layer homology domain-containing protein [Thermoanaerobaculia bacterium]|jgi:hypothetical protein|nr:S-layer homology domain-containing protein [Thermoanaerobaculia bacterium]
MRRLGLRTGFAVLIAVSLVSGTAQAAQRHSKQGTSRPASASRPETYGTQDYTITSISDLSFTPFDSGSTFAANSDDYFRYFTVAGGSSFVAGATIPAGAIIDYIGFGSCDEAGANWTVYAYETLDDGSFADIGTFNSSAHGATTTCTTDYNVAALNYQIAVNEKHTIQLEVLQSATAPVDGSVRFSSVELWWRRTVSPAPATATFNDVPTDHPFFQYIEALAASGITGGCGNGNYCPDAPLTRGQMAVFLSKALGLHWTGALPN